MAKLKLRKYELIYLVQPEATDEDRQKINDRVDQTIEKYGTSKLIKREEWGKRKLAYEIRKFNKAYYFYQILVGPPGLTQEIERVLRMLDNCVRFMTIKLEEDLDPVTSLADDEPVAEEAAQQQEASDA
jgi:small subunit ribosomal protein S6